MASIGDRLHSEAPRTAAPSYGPDLVGSRVTSDRRPAGGHRHAPVIASNCPRVREPSDAHGTACWGHADTLPISTPVAGLQYPTVLL